MSELNLRVVQLGTLKFVHSRVSRLLWIMIVTLALTHAFAWAQVSSPKAALPLPLPSDPTQAVEEVAGVYRNGPIGERITIRVTTASGSSDRRSVLLHAARNKDESATRRRLHLDLARLEFWLDGTTGTVTNRADPTTYFQFSVAEPVSFDALFRDLRPIPLPQVGWCLGEAGNRPLGSMLGVVTWSSVQLRDSATSEIIGSAASGEVRLAIDNVSRRIRSFSARLPRGVVLELSCSPANGAVWTTWMPSLTGRARVESLIKLQSATPKATVGQRLPSIAYITTGYEGWVLPNADDATPVFVVFVRSGASGEVAPALRKETLSVIDAVRSHMHAKSEKGLPARLVLVGVLAPGNTQPEDLAKNATAWIDSMDNSPLSPVWTTAEWSLIAGGHVDAEVLLHVVGAERKLLGTISCDVDCEGSEIERRVREVVEQARVGAEHPQK